MYTPAVNRNRCQPGLNTQNKNNDVTTIPPPFSSERIRHIEQLAEVAHLLAAYLNHLCFPSIAFHHAIEQPRQEFYDRKSQGRRFRFSAEEQQDSLQ
jgi:hypothetical protein